MGDAAASTRMDAHPGIVAVLGDIVAVTGFTLLVGLLLVLGAVDGTLRVLLVAPLIGFCPGYGIVSALMPARTPTPISARGYGSRLGHRAALAVPTSLFAIVLAAIPLSLVGFTFSGAVFVATVVGITVVSSLIAIVRRFNVPASERVRLPTGALRDEIRAGVNRAPPVDAALNVLLALAIVTALGAFAVGLAAPDRGVADSEVALVSEENGELVAGNFTESYERGEESTVRLAVENREGEETTYTAVVALERLGSAGNETAVLERVVLSNTNVTVVDGETVVRQLSFTPSLLGDSLRLSVYVYVGESPETVSPETADYHLYRWVEVREQGAVPSQSEG